MTPIVWQPGMAIEQGIYLNMPESAYFSVGAIGVSDLKVARKAWYKFRYGEKTHTRAQAIGTLFHTGLLEPHLLDVRYCTSELKIFNPAHKAYQAELERAGSRELIKVRDMDDMLKMRAHVMNQGGPLVACLNHPNMLVEVSFFWWDYPANVFCRGRADLLVLEHGIAGDLKSCEDADIDFEKSVRNYQYNWQVSFYLRGLRRLGIEIGDFVFFAIEKSSPFLHAPWYCHPDDIDHADRIISEMLMQYRQCIDTDTWPALPQEIGTIKLSEYNLQRQ